MTANLFDTLLSRQPHRSQTAHLKLLQVSANQGMAEQLDGEISGLAGTPNASLGRARFP